jgi:hypothetical protein
MRSGSIFADVGFPRGARRDEDVAGGQRTAACREAPWATEREVAMPWFPEFVSAVELAAQADSRRESG